MTGHELSHWNHLHWNVEKGFGFAKRRPITKAGGGVVEMQEDERDLLKERRAS